MTSRTFASACIAPCLALAAAASQAQNTTHSDAGDLQLFYRGALEELLQSNRNLDDLKAGKRLDSIRAIAVFTRGGFLHLPHMEFSSIGPDRPGDSFL
jgi:hypothetical protein